MHTDALKYQFDKYFGSQDRIFVYYDFSIANVFSIQEGSVWQAYLKNLSPMAIGEPHHGKIVGATGSSSGMAVEGITGYNGFLSQGIGDFTKNYLQISGESPLNLNDSSYLFLVNSELNSDGVIMGSLKREDYNFGDLSISSYSGFNFGINSRGKSFFQSADSNGEFCFVKNEDELSPRSLIGLNFSNSETTMFRFDYINNKILSESFPLQSFEIRDGNNLFLGASPYYWREGFDSKLFSGKMEKFLMLKGNVSQEELFELGAGMLSEYYFESGTATPIPIFSGFVSSITYKEGITGSYSLITGYDTVIGEADFSLDIISTGQIELREGSRYYKNFNGYLEEEGFLNNDYLNKYSPTGEGAFGVLGLQTGASIVTGYLYSGYSFYSTTQVPSYETGHLYGTTEEISGVTNTAVYVSGLSYTDDVSGILFSDSFDGFSKNYIYYLGER